MLSKQTLGVFLKMLPLVSLLACTHTELDQEVNCAQVDWYELGRRDGIAGISAANFEDEIHRCDPKEITHNHRTLYEYGRSFGLTSYCTGPMGFQVGKLGEKYEGVCPKALENDFVRSYAVGRQIHILEKENDLIQSRIKSLQNQIDKMQDGNINDEILKLHQQFSQNESKIRDLASKFN